MRDLLENDNNPAAGRLQNAPDDVQQRGLTRPALTTWCDHLARADFQAHIAQRIDAGLTFVEVLGNSLHTDKRAFSARVDHC